MSRIKAIDQIRGLSLMGILLVNAIGFAMPLEVYSNPAWSPLPFSQADRAVWGVMETFFHEKFISLFSMLFGVSLFLVHQSGVGNQALVVARRLLFLLCIGLIHGAFIWAGDVLLLYAVTGMVFTVVMQREAKLLLTYGVGLFFVGNLLISLNGLSLEAAHQSPLKPASEIAAKIALMRGDIFTSFKGNFLSWQSIIINEIGAFLPITLGLMMTGLGLFKIGFFNCDRAQIVRKYIKIVALIALVLMAIQAYVTQAHNFNPQSIMGSGALLNRFLSPLVGLGYAAVLVDIDLGAISRGLESLGRMAFSHYICQSLIMTAIFYAGRAPLALHLGLYGQLNYAALVPFVLAIWVFQWAWGRLWLRHFRYGPLEYVWRCFTHAEFVKITR